MTTTATANTNNTNNTNMRKKTTIGHRAANPAINKVTEIVSPGTVPPKTVQSVAVPTGTVPPEVALPRAVPLKAVQLKFASPAQSKSASSGKPAACRDGRPTVRRDGDAVVIDVPMSLRRRSGRKEVVLPPDAVIASDTPTKPRPPAPLAVALARAFHWQEMIESGQATSNCDLARKLKLDQSYIARTIRLTSLAPNIIEAILTGQGPNNFSLWSLRRDLPLSWQEQQKQLGIDESEYTHAGV